MTTSDYLLLFSAAAGAGAVNALAGGGTLISFPVLLALGVPPIAANVTNAIALCPGYLGGTIAQWRNVRDQKRRLWVCIPAAVLGGLVGAVVLLETRERVFQALVPYMLLTASLLLAVQERVRAFAVRRSGDHHQGEALSSTAIVVSLAAVYGGFFSAGMSVIVLAVLAATLDDSFAKLNALKQVTAFSVNVAATVFFLFSDQVIWQAAGIMAVGALVGGAVGGKLAGWLDPSTLRWTIVCVGVILSIYYWVT
jgi:uncharacterized membrane protein YfcA